MHVLPRAIALSVLLPVAAAAQSPSAPAPAATSREQTAAPGSQQPPVQQAPAGQQAPAAQQPPAAGTPVAPAPVPSTAPGPAVSPVVPVVPAPAVVAPLPGARVFSAPTGLLFNTVRPDRVKDFETFLGYLKGAFDKTTNPQVQAQVRGWRIFKATETGPNNAVLYVFVLDPTVQNADYSLGRLIVETYGDKAPEIWKLYQSALTGGGTLLNLAPVVPVPVTPVQPPVR